MTNSNVFMSIPLWGVKIVKDERRAKFICAIPKSSLVRNVQMKGLQPFYDKK